MNITKARLRQIIKEEINRFQEPQEASSIVADEGVYNDWYTLGKEIESMSTKAFATVQEDFNYVLDLLEGVKDPYSEFWKEEAEDSGYAEVPGYADLTNVQLDVYHTIGRIKRDLFNSELRYDAGDLDAVAENIIALEPPVEGDYNPDYVTAM